MKKLLLLICLLILIIPASVVLSSNLTGAYEKALLTVSNNGTLASAVSCNFSLSTTVLQNIGWLNAAAADCAIVDAAGNDVPFMPGYTPSGNPWVLFIDSINPSSSQNYYLFTGNVTGGKEAIFGSMTVVDSPSLEMSSNGTIAVTDIQINTSASANVVYKPNAYKISTGSGNITLDISGYNDTIQQTDIQFSPAIALPYYTAYAEKFTDFPASVINSATVPLKKNGSPTGTGYLKVWDSSNTTLGTLGSIDVSTISTSYADYTFNSTPVTISSAKDIRVGFEFIGGTWGANFISTRDYGSNKCNFYSGSIMSAHELFDTVWQWVDDATYDFTFSIALSVSPVSLSTALSPSEYDLSFDISNNNASLSVESVEILSGVFPKIANTADNIIFFSGVPYAVSAGIYVGGNHISEWTWEYGTTTLHDLIGSNDATWTPHTTPSDADVTTSLGAFEVVMPAEAEDTFSVLDPSEVITADYTAPTQLYTDMDLSKIPAADVINSFLDISGTPRALWWFIVIYLSIAIFGLMIYGLTKSLLTQFAVCELLFVALGIMGPIPLWNAFLFPIPAIAIILSTKHYGWG